MKQPENVVADRSLRVVDLVAELRTETGDVFQGVVSGIDDAVVTVDFPSGENPLLPIAQEVHLHFAGDGLTRPLATTAEVVARATDGESQRYEFRLDELTGSALATIYNRRRAMRVPLDPEHPIQATLRGSGTVPVQAEMCDLSEAGVAVLVDQEHEGILYQAWRVELSFCLPGDESPLELAALVRYRMQVGSAIRYGLLFDPYESPDFGSMQARIAVYVEERRRAMLGKQQQAGSGA
jgi:hypothetical protein